MARPSKAGSITKNVRNYKMMYARKYLDMTQSQAAEKAEVPYGTWGAIEVGRQIPTEEQAIRIAKALKHDVTDLFSLLRYNYTTRMSKKNFSKLALLRDQKGLTQEALANKLGITPRDVSNVEMGHTTKDASVPLKIAAYFGVSVSELGINVSREYIEGLKAKIVMIDDRDTARALAKVLR